MLKPVPGGGSGSTLHILSRDGDSDLTVQETAWQSHSGASFTIKRAYNDFATWEGERGGDLVADDKREVGVCYEDNDTHFTPGSTITIAGSTTDWSRFMKLTVAEGHRHDGTADTGVVVDFGSASADGFDVQDNYTVIEWLDIADYRGSFSDGVRLDAFGAVVQNVLIRDFNDTETRGILVLQDAAIRNTIILNEGMEGIYVQGGTVTIENVTIYAPLGPGTQDGIEFDPGTTAIIRNTISVGNAVDDFDLNGTVTYFGYNMYENVAGFDPVPLQGNNQTPPLVDLGELFISIAPGSENLHLEPTGHDAGNNGVDLSGSFQDDIDGATRSGAWDIGADEAISGGGGTPRIISWKEIEP